VSGTLLELHCHRCGDALPAAERAARSLSPDEPNFRFSAGLLDEAPERYHALPDVELCDACWSKLETLIAEFVYGAKLAERLRALSAAYDACEDNHHADEVDRLIADHIDAQSRLLK